MEALLMQCPLCSRSIQHLYQENNVFVTSKTSGKGSGACFQLLSVQCATYIPTFIHIIDRFSFSQVYSTNFVTVITDHNSKVSSYETGNMRRKNSDDKNMEALDDISEMLAQAQTALSEDGFTDSPAVTDNSSIDDAYIDSTSRERAKTKEKESKV